MSGDIDPPSDEKFRRWITEPLKALRALDHGDGAFAALAIACGLYERFVDSSIHAAGKSATPEEFRVVAAADLGCSEEAVDRFYNGFRLGLAHAFHPKQYVEKKGQGDRWGWDIDEADGYCHFPEIVKTAANAYVVKIDPWKFVQHVEKRWAEHPELRNQLAEFAFGHIRAVAPAAPAPADSRPSEAKAYCTYQSPPDFTATGLR
jgi:hypothetical protein